MVKSVEERGRKKKGLCPIRIKFHCFYCILLYLIISCCMLCIKLYPISWHCIACTHHKALYGSLSYCFLMYGMVLYYKALEYILLYEISTCCIV